MRMKSKKKKKEETPESFDRRVASIIHTWKTQSGKTIGVTTSQAPRTKKPSTKAKRNEYHTFLSIVNKNHPYGRFQFQRNYRTQRFSMNYTGPSFHHFAELDEDDFVSLLAYCWYAITRPKRYLRIAK
jgi:hypothetical protein